MIGARTKRRRVLEPEIGLASDFYHSTMVFLASVGEANSIAVNDRCGHY